MKVEYGECDLDSGSIVNANPHVKCSGRLDVVYYLLMSIDEIKFFLTCYL